MSSRRTARVAKAVKETVSTNILFNLKDPRVKNVTVTHVEVSGDLRNAKVYVSVMGSEKTQSLTMHGLNSARGFLQSKIGDRLKTRWTPVLKFILDPGVKRSAETSRILREVLPPDETEEEENLENETEETEESQTEGNRQSPPEPEHEAGPKDQNTTTSPSDLSEKDDDLPPTSPERRDLG